MTDFKSVDDLLNFVVGHVHSEPAYMLSRKKYEDPAVLVNLESAHFDYGVRERRDVADLCEQIGSNETARLIREFTPNPLLVPIVICGEGFGVAYNVLSRGAVGGNFGGYA
jgi:hypothetical protein